MGLDKDVLRAQRTPFSQYLRPKNKTVDAGPKRPIRNGQDPRQAAPTMPSRTGGDNGQPSANQIACPNCGHSFMPGVGEQN